MLFQVWNNMLYTYYTTRANTADMELLKKVSEAAAGWHGSVPWFCENNENEDEDKMREI